jgi:tetratricopeptide (TPR) repeat protein
VINQTIVVNNGDDREADAKPIDEERFLRFEPRKRKPDDAQARREQAKPAEPKERARPDAPKPDARPAERMVPKPADKPKDEHARQLAQGKEAFEGEAYAEADRRFEQAERAKPEDPLAYFLRAQAQFAQRQFREAVESIEAGLRRRPDWPGAPFRVRDLYGENATDYVEHRKRLEEALERNPNDPFLLFLLGYQLWFDGKQGEAKELFQRALKLAPERDKQFINRFLLHGMPVAQNGR